MRVLFSSAAVMPAAVQATSQSPVQHKPDSVHFGAGTPFHLQSLEDTYNGNLEAVREYLDKGGDPNVKTAAGGNTGLYLAVLRADEEMVKLYLANPKTNLQAENNYRGTPLGKARYEGNLKPKHLVQNTPAQRETYQRIARLIEEAIAGKPSDSGRTKQPAPPPSEDSGRTKQPAPPPADDAPDNPPNDADEHQCKHAAPQKTPLQEIVSGFLRLLGIR